MSQTITLPFVFAELVTLNGEKIVNPVSFPETVWLAKDGQQLPKKFQQALQKEVTDKCEYLELLRMSNVIEVQKKTVQVEIKPQKKQTLFPRHQQQYIYFQWLMSENQWFGYIPALAIQVSATTEGDLVHRLSQSIQLEYIRKGRYGNLRKQIEVLWYLDANINIQGIKCDVYSTTELENKHNHQQTSLLSSVAAQLKPTAHHLYEMDQQLTEFSQAIEGKYARSVLIVGPNGSGKTALLNGWLRLKKFKKNALPWETSASLLLQGLTKDGGWQKNIALLANEIRDKQVLLYVNHLLELFEVGQYVGNNISMGESLRDPLQRGEIQIVGECTEEELAVLENKAPGFGDLFFQVKMPEKSVDVLRTIVTQQIQSIAKKHRVEIELEAIEEINRLHQRYSPYSGLPGKTIRFLETLLIKSKTNISQVSKAHVINAFCEESGVPIFMVDPQHSFDIAVVKTFFMQHVFGQNMATVSIVDLLVRIKTTLTRVGKPVASLLFVGPTGTGKTEMAKTLAHFMFGDENRLLRLDMSEYADPVSVLRLTGDAGQQGQSLVTRIRQQPFSVVLFDELEKAHVSFFDLLLQVLGEGRLTDAHGQVANFCSAIIIMTSNIGAAKYQKAVIGFSNHHERQESVKLHFEQSVQAYFRPELFNRLDQIISFSPLGHEERRLIVERELNRLKSRKQLAGQHQLSWNDDALVILANETGKQKYGARQTHRLIQRQVTIPIARYLNQLDNEKINMVIQSDQAQLSISYQVAENSDLSTHTQIKYNEQAENLTQIRRWVMHITDGPVTIQLQSELDILKHKQQKSKKKFWQSKINVERFHNIEKMFDQWSTYNQNLIAAEAEILHITTGVNESELLENEPLLLQYAEQIKALYQLAYPQSGECLVAIYGRDPHLTQWYQFYCELIALCGFECQAEFVYLVAEQYKKQAVSLPQKKTDKPDQLLCGYEIRIKGQCVYPFFKNETGLVEWKISSRNKPRVYVMVCQNTANYNTPDEVYRRQFFESSSVKKTVDDSVLVDKEAGFVIPLEDVRTYYDICNARLQNVIYDYLTATELF